MDNLATAAQRLSSEVVPDKPPSSSANAQPPSNAKATQDNDARVDVVDKKGKEKVEWKKKEPVFFKGVELVDLDDCNVPDMRLQCDSEDTDDDDALNVEDIDIGNGSTSNSQCLEPNTSPTAEPPQSSAGAHGDCPSKAIPSIHDPFFNAVGKAPHPDAVIVKHEAGWFYYEEMWSKMTANCPECQQ